MQKLTIPLKFSEALNPYIILPTICLNPLKYMVTGKRLVAGLEVIGEINLVEIY